MLALFRALVYGSLFVGLLLVVLPGQVLRASGIATPAGAGVPQIAGLAILGLGAALALWCILTFALVGRGTPAPFDPPRRLVTAGPYRFVRNPMYIGADLVLTGAALYYRSTALLGYALAFAAVTHLFVLLYEEPTLSRLFGAAYNDYRRTVNRWVPRWRS